MSTPLSLQAVPSGPSDARSRRKRPSAARRTFDTMEDLFFKQGDELSQLAPADYDPDDVTELVPHADNRRKLALWLAATTVVVVGLAVLLF